MKTKFTSAALLLSAVVAVLPSCTLFSKQLFTKYDFNSFDTVSSVMGYERGETEFSLCAQRIFDTLYEYHRLYDIYHEYAGINNLATVNARAGDGEWISVDRRITELLLFSFDMYTLTDGEVNIAFGSVLKLWHNAREAAEEKPENAFVPNRAALAYAAEHTDISCIEIDKNASAVRITDAELRIDVGAIAKGYAAERVARELEAEGVSGYLLNVGGNVRAIGSQPDGSPWRIGLENPFDDGRDYIDVIALSDGAVVTSGAYQRYFVYNGVSYNHIIDGKILFPADKYESVTVICPDSGMADAISTALFIMDRERGESMLAELGKVSAIWVYKDGNVVRSSS